jgi:hypothetical protein
VSTPLINAIGRLEHECRKYRNHGVGPAVTKLVLWPSVFVALEQEVRGIMTPYSVAMDESLPLGVLFIFGFRVESSDAIDPAGCGPALGGLVPGAEALDPIPRADDAQPAGEPDETGIADRPDPRLGSDENDLD